MEESKSSSNEAKCEPLVYEEGSTCADAHATATKEPFQFISKPVRIDLEIPAEMEGYATSHGAQHDCKKNKWYVLDDVPEPLEAFAPPPSPRQPVYEFAPTCPACGSYMVKRYRKWDGDPFWGCSQFPRCHGILEWKAESFVDRRELVSSSHELESSPAKRSTPLRERLRLRWHEISALLLIKLGNKADVEKWLFNPHHKLKNKMPAEVMFTWSGCSEVERLANNLPDPLDEGFRVVASETERLLR